MDAALRPARLFQHNAAAACAGAHGFARQRNDGGKKSAPAGEGGRLAFSGPKVRLRARLGGAAEAPNFAGQTQPAG
jgi:hypothetical protein